MPGFPTDPFSPEGASAHLSPDGTSAERSPARRRSTRRALLLGSALAGTVLVASCQAVEEFIMEPFRGETPHERYVERLERSGLGDAALARDWIAAAREAVIHPVSATLPMVEEGWFPAEQPTALGYRVEMERGQRLTVSVALEGDRDTRVFVDVFRLRGERDPDDPSYLTVAWAEDDDRAVVYDASTTGSFLVRVQPELLRAGAYQVSLRIGPSLAIPVEGASLRDIGSFFGASRDGGRRQHHGVDIFAARGTPVLAAGDGVVRRARETPVGGLNVWVRNDATGHSEYYAHLDSYIVEAGQRVSAGDTLGFVGNTGNASTTPPHLHFGIYARGPTDPLPYIRDPGGRPAPLQVERDWFHRRAFLAAAGVPIFSHPASPGDTVAVGGAALPVHVLAGSGTRARIRLPDGRHGFVDPAHLELEDDPLRWHRAVLGAQDESP